MPTTRPHEAVTQDKALIPDGKHVSCCQLSVDAFDCIGLWACFAALVFLVHLAMLACFCSVDNSPRVAVARAPFLTCSGPPTKLTHYLHTQHGFTPETHRGTPYAYNALSNLTLTRSGSRTHACIVTMRR